MTASSAPLDVLIVDDEPHAVRRLCLLCARLDGVRVIGTAVDGHAALGMLESLRPDVVLLDIAMPGIDGMTVAQATLACETPPAIVFVTAHDRFAVQAFDLAAADYLLKPVAIDRLDRALQRLKPVPSTAGTILPASISSQDLWVPRNGHLLRVPISSLERVEAERDYVHLHVAARSFLMSGTITELESRLDPAVFVRVHRSWIVRRLLVTKLRRTSAGGWIVILLDGTPIPVGRTYLAQLRSGIVVVPFSAT